MPITLVAAAEKTFLRLFTPKEAKDPMQTSVKFPAGDISLLSGIAPIGTKFDPPEAHGPQGGPNRVRRLGQWYQGEVFLFFGAVPQ